MLVSVVVVRHNHEGKVEEEGRRAGGFGEALRSHAQAVHKP